MTVLKEETALELKTPTPIELLQAAVNQNLDIDKLKELMQLEREWRKDRAREAFVHAMNEFKKNPPTILKNKAVSFGNTSYNHATLDHVCDAVTKGLSEHGITHRWNVSQNAAQIAVTCVLTHELGHSEETTLSAGADTSGSKNGIQAIGSTVTYLQRYTLLAATGLAASNQDNDGQTGQTMGDLAEQIEYIENCRNQDELRKVFGASYRAAKELNDKRSMDALRDAYEKMKRAL